MWIRDRSRALAIRRRDLFDCRQDNAFFSFVRGLLAPGPFFFLPSAVFSSLASSIVGHGFVSAIIEGLVDSPSRLWTALLNDPIGCPYTDFIKLVSHMEIPKTRWKKALSRPVPLICGFLTVIDNVFPSFGKSDDLTGLFRLNSVFSLEVVAMTVA